MGDPVRGRPQTPRGQKARGPWRHAGKPNVRPAAPGTGGSDVMSVFGATYSSAYDLLYQEKGYDRECDFLEEIFAQTGNPVRTILDLGCGTGGHALVLARRGYSVTGVDRSHRMVSIAREKARRENLSIEFVESDIRDLALDRSFDAVIAMFAVMSYQTRNEDVEAFCAAASGHLREEGVFAFDCWNGLAVLSDRPTCRLRDMSSGEKERVIRFTTPMVNAIDQTVLINFRMWHLENHSVLSEVEETHPMRFFFPQEITYFLEKAGFGTTSLCPFACLNSPLTEQDWNMGVIARKNGTP